MQTLISWIGKTDLDCAMGNRGEQAGPILQAAQSSDYREIYLLCDYSKAEGNSFATYLKHHGYDCTVRFVNLSSPTSYREIYAAARAFVSRVVEQHPNASLTLHLSPGTPAMASIWIILSRTVFKADLIESSLEAGVQPVDLPFEISAEFIPEIERGLGDRLARLSEAAPPASPEFTKIVHQSPRMQSVIGQARTIAIRDVPVLVLGESGTGKELLARAIHSESVRSDGPFVAVNCGAVPLELFDSEFFGHEKGAFTGAVSKRIGYFRAATGGTLFLDEIGELPKTVQVKLLRALQEHEVIPIGSYAPVAIDCRVIAATNRDLHRDVVEGRFREDLFHRLAVGVLKLPALREREGDIGLISKALVDDINSQLTGQPGYDQKRLSTAAAKEILACRWPGNIRELHNVLFRAMLWTSDNKITAQDIRDAFSTFEGSAATLPVVQIGDGFDLRRLLADTRRAYVEKALELSGGNKSKAARLLGLSNYQTLDNWLKQ